MAKRITAEDLELLGELGVETASAAPDTRSAREQRIVAGFEEIERFVTERGRLPQHGEDRDIFERLYAVRLDRMRELPECREVLSALDARGLLDGDRDAVAEKDVNELSDDELLASLGVERVEDNDVTRLVHVRSRDEIKAAEEIAQRDVCPDFDAFKPHFDRVKAELKTGARQSVKYRDNAEIQQGDWFIVDGQTALVAEMGETFISDYGKPDSRLRVVYDNATQNELLLRSLQRALNRDKGSRRIVVLDGQGHLPLFGDESSAASDALNENETASGTIYVLRSQSDHPFIAEHRSIIHKIGVTGGDVPGRIAGARQDPTFLLSDVELVATFHLKNINRQKLEALLHKFLGAARLDMELEDRFKTPVKPKEWFFVPLQVIEQIIDKINDGTLDAFRYDLETATLMAI